MIKIDKAYNIIVGKLETWIESFISMLPNLLLCIAILIVFWLVSKLAKKLIMKLIDKISTNLALKRLVGQLTFFTVMSIGIFIALSVLKLDKAVTSLLAGAGVIGLALGFAFQDSATNFISGVFIAVRKPFRIGDIITTTDQMGTVERMNLRNIIMRSFQGQEVIIPNKDVFQNTIINYSSTSRRRVDIVVGVSYNDDLEKVRKIASEAISNLDLVLKDKDIDIFFLEFDNSSINFRAQFWIDYPNETGFLRAQSEAIIAIKKAFDENNITIPFPIRTLDIDPNQIKPFFEEQTYKS